MPTYLARPRLAREEVVVGRALEEVAAVEAHLIECERAAQLAHRLLDLLLPDELVELALQGGATVVDKLWTSGAFASVLADEGQQLPPRDLSVAALVHEVHQRRQVRLIALNLKAL